jgi:predicted permease
LLTRAAGRSREVAIRAAIGAGRGRILRQLLTESILLSAAGALIGLLAATSITDVLAAHAPGSEYILSSAGLPLDRTVYLFAAAVALACGIGAGIFPAVQASRTDVAHSLRDSSRSATPSRATQRFRNILVGGEVALSLVLLLSAGLLIRSFSRLLEVNPGMRLDHTLTFGTSLPQTGYAKRVQRVAFERQLAERMRSIPGVIAAGLTSCAPLGGHCGDRVFEIEGRPNAPGHFPDALQRAVDPNYFAAAGIPLIAGRTFHNEDGIGMDEAHPKTGAIIVDQTFAREFFPNEDPIGKHILRSRPMAPYEIVGVVGNVLTGLDQKPEPTMYEPLFDGREFDTFVVLHTAGDPHAVFAAAKQEIAKLDPDLAIYQVRTMEEIAGMSAADRKFSVLVFGSFAGMALLLAVVGL